MWLIGQIVINIRKKETAKQDQSTANLKVSRCHLGIFLFIQPFRSNKGTKYKCQLPYCLVRPRVLASRLPLMLPLLPRPACCFYQYMTRNIISPKYNGNNYVVDRFVPHLIGIIPLDESGATTGKQTVQMESFLVSEQSS